LLRESREKETEEQPGRGLIQLSVMESAGTPFPEKASGSKDLCGESEKGGRIRRGNALPRASELKGDTGEKRGKSEDQKVRRGGRTG